MRYNIGIFGLGVLAEDPRYIGRTHTLYYFWLKISLWGLGATWIPILTSSDIQLSVERSAAPGKTQFSVIFD